MTTDWSWAEATKIYLDKTSGFINMGWAATSAHRGTDLYNKMALRFIKRDWPHDPNAIHDYSYFNLEGDSHLLSFALQRLGVKKGDCVFTVSPRLHEVYLVALGALKRGALFAPLFSAFGPEPIQTRISKGSGRVLLRLEISKRKVWLSRGPQMPVIKSFRVALGGDFQEFVHKQGLCFAGRA